MIVEPELARRRFEADIKPLLDDGAPYEAFGVRLVEYEWPALVVALRWGTREIRLRIDATDYDTQPVSGRWVDHNGGPLLAGQKLVPSGNGFHHQGPQPGTPGRLCFAGWREYYELHSQDAWSAIRGQAQYKPLALIQHIASLLGRGVEAA